MRILINILAGLGAIVAIFMTIALYGGVMGDAFSDGAGMAIIAFQLIGAIGAADAIAFGFIGRVMDRRAPKPASFLSNGAIAVGLLCGALIFGMPFIFG